VIYFTPLGRFENRSTESFSAESPGVNASRRRRTKTLLSAVGSDKHSSHTIFPFSLSLLASFSIYNLGVCQHRAVGVALRLSHCARKLCARAKKSCRDRNRWFSATHTRKTAQLGWRRLQIFTEHKFAQPLCAIASGGSLRSRVRNRNEVGQASLQVFPFVKLAVQR
jgi:hypothetical protein